MDEITLRPGQLVTVRVGSRPGGAPDLVTGLIHEAPRGKHTPPRYVWVQTTRDSEPMLYRRRSVELLAP